MTKGQFKLQKLMDVGTSNPIVAGLTIGLHDIVQMAEIDKQTKDTINATNLNIAQSLTKAEKIGIQICENIESIMDGLKKTGVQTQSCERCVNVPSTDGLDDVREVLKYGKHALQELVKIINLFCDTGCTSPNYKTICAKIKQDYGETDPLFLLVKQDHDGWIKEFLDLRNSDEHPNCIPQGKQFYYDFDINWSESHQKWIVVVPHFYDDTSIYELIKTSIHNIFTFSEEINILFLQKYISEMFQICKVSDDQRVGWGGRRFVLQLKPSFYPKSEKPKKTV